MDAVFLANADLLPVVDSGTMDIRARFDHFIQPDRVRLADARAVPAALGQVAEVLRVNNPNATVLTGLADLVAKAEADRQALTVPVLLADVQLAALALLILVVVAAMTAEARAGEVALAKVRGATTGQAFGLAVLELAVITAVALPAGLAVGWLGAYLLARSQLGAGIPVVVTPAAVVVALAAAAVALGAASLASLGAVRRRVLDQWRRGRSDQVARRGSCWTWCCCWSPRPPWPTCAPPGPARPPAAMTCSPPSPPAWPCWPPPWSSAARCRWSRAGWSGSPAARPGWRPGSGPARWPAAAGRPCGW